MKLSPRVWLLLIPLAAFALRLYRLGAASLWYDETVSLFLARQDLVALTRHTAGDIHPPLYYYLLHFWGQFAGWSEFSAAFLSLFFGVLLIALIYHVAQEWFDRQVASIAALLVAISPYNLGYSQEVRMYTLGATLGLASVFFFVRLLAAQTTEDRQQTTDRFSSPSPRPSPIISRDFIAYAAVSALGLYTLYYFAFLLVFENLVALVWLIRNYELRIANCALRTWFLSQLAVLLVYAPWLPIAFRQAIDPPVPPWRSFTALSSVLPESFSALALGQSVEPAAVWPVLLVVAIVVTFALWRDTNRQSLTTNCLFLLAYTLVPLTAIYALSLWKPLYHVRYVFIYSPGFYLLLALGIARISNLELQITHYYVLRNSGRWLTTAALLLLAASAAYSAYNFWFAPRYADDDLRGAVQRIAAAWRPGDAVLINAGYTYTAFAYYYDQPIAWHGRLTDYVPRDARAGAVILRTGSIGGSASLGWGSPESDFYATTADETRAALDRVFAAHPRVWLLRLYDTVVDPDGVIRDYLTRHGRIIDDQVFTGESNARVQGYLTTRVPLTALPASATRRDVVLGNRIVLLGFEPTAATVRAGAALDTTLYWRAKQATNVDEHVFVGLYAEDGKLFASSEEAPLGNALGTSRWSSEEILREPVRVIVPPDVRPGNYILRVAMFNPLTNEPLDADDRVWITEGGQIELAQVRVEQ
jgi:4-amino-4-deoxy-L-arabinose transferase-like glycosyltransferase